MWPSASNVAVLVCSTSRRTLEQPLRPFEVLVDEAHGFKETTVVDCRWVYTILKSIIEPGALLTRLPL
jgi:hypothetical protein